MREEEEGGLSQTHSTGFQLNWVNLRLLLLTQQTRAPSSCWALPRVPTCRSLPCPKRGTEQQHSGARPVKPEPLWALHLPTSTVPSPGTHGRCRGGCCAPELAPPWGHGLQDGESSGDEEVETWKEKPHSSIRWMGEMQMASSNTSGPQEGGRRGLMDGGCLEGAQPARCPPLHVSAPVPHRPLPQFPLWGCQGWQEEPGELDEPSQDLTTGAGSIPPVLQARAGREVQPHVCQGTLGTCHCQPTMGENAPKLSRGGSGPLILPPPASQHCQCPRDPKSTPNPFGHGMSIALSAGSG